jgi:hypothetical protein
MIVAIPRSWVHHLTTAELLELMLRVRHSVGFVSYDEDLSEDEYIFEVECGTPAEQHLMVFKKSLRNKNK